MGVNPRFFPKTYKNRPAARGFALEPPLPLAAGGYAPRPLYMICLSSLAYSTRFLS